MIKKIPLKNASVEVIVDPQVYDFVYSDEYFQKILLPQNLRRHSSGYAFFKRIGSLVVVPIVAKPFIYIK